MKTAQQIRDNLDNLAKQHGSSEQERALNLFKVMFDEATEKMFKEGLLLYHLPYWPYKPFKTAKFGIPAYIREHGFEYKWDQSRFGIYSARCLCLIVPKK